MKTRFQILELDTKAITSNPEYMDWKSLTPKEACMAMEIYADQQTLHFFDWWQKTPSIQLRDCNNMSDALLKYKQENGLTK
jgi:DNA primase